DPDLGQVRKGDARSGTDQHPLHGSDHVRIDARRVWRLAGAAAEHTAAVHQSAGHARAFACRGGHGHGHAQYGAELDQSEDEDQQYGWKDERELDQTLRVFAPEKPDHSLGSARVIVASVNVTLFPAKRTKLV